LAVRHAKPADGPVVERDRIESSPAEIIVNFSGEKKRSTLHVLAVGIDKYRNPALNLNYARKDAESVAKFFSSAPRGLFKDVAVSELSDAGATRASILGHLKDLQNTPQQDVVVIYLAGHGDSLPDSWYFIPHEVAYPERQEELRKKAISSAEIQQAVRNIGAQKIVLLMDACKSGSALTAFATRGFEERKALAQLARATGVHVVAASTKDQLAAEVKELGHGVFTYTVLKGLGGKADGSRDGTVTVRELLSFVEGALPDLSQKYKSEAQFPVVDSRGMDFPLASANQ
ncbi:caspase domain-containing protein, partial [Elusimicrobiota bacterium]